MSGDFQERKAAIIKDCSDKIAVIEFDISLPDSWCKEQRRQRLLSERDSLLEELSERSENRKQGKEQQRL